MSLTPATQSSYNRELIGNWVPQHNQQVLVQIEPVNNHEIKITNEEKLKTGSDTSIFIAHGSTLNNHQFLNIRFSEKASSSGYFLLQYDLPCMDVIHITFMDTALFDKDVRLGHIKGRVRQDFLTFRYIEDTRDNLQKYILDNRKRLFTQHRYLIRASAINKLPDECSAHIGPAYILE